MALGSNRGTFLNLDFLLSLDCLLYIDVLLSGYLSTSYQYARSVQRSSQSWRVCVMCHLHAHPAGFILDRKRGLFHFYLVPFSQQDPSSFSAQNLSNKAAEIAATWHPIYVFWAAEKGLTPRPARWRGTCPGTETNKSCFVFWTILASAICKLSQYRTVDM